MGCCDCGATWHGAGAAPRAAACALGHGQPGMEHGAEAAPAPDCCGASATWARIRMPGTGLGAAACSNA
eukprot:481253-Alexandrium_andersonii.AAC.1